MPKGGGMAVEEGGGERGDDGGAEIDADAGARCRRKLNLRICPLLALALWCSWLEKLNISLALPGLKASLQLTDAQAGFAISAFFITYPVFMTPCTLLAKRIGPRRGLTLMLTSFGAVGMLQASARSFAGLVGLRLLLGVCEAGFFPFYAYSVSTYYGERNIGFALSMINSIQLFLSIFSGPFGALVLFLSRDGGGSLEPWQWLFIVEGIPSVLVGLLILVCLPSGPLACASFMTSKEHAWLMRHVAESSAERERQGMKLSTAGAPSSAPPRWTDIAHAVGGLVCDFRVVMCALILFAQATSFFGYYYFMPLLLTSTGSSLALISALDAIPTVISIGLSLLTSHFSDKFRKRLPILVGLVVTTSAGLLLTAMLVDRAGFAAQFAAISVAGIGGKGGFLPIFNAYETDFLPPDKAALGLALINAAGSIGGVAGPNIVGRVRDASGGFSLPLLVMGCISMSAVAFLVLLSAFGRRVGLMRLPSSGSELEDVAA